jgi:hypothetical protein
MNHVCEYCNKDFLVEETDRGTLVECPHCHEMSEVASHDGGAAERTGLLAVVLSASLAVLYVLTPLLGAVVIYGIGRTWSQSVTEGSRGGSGANAFFAHGAALDKAASIERFFTILALLFLLAGIVTLLVRWQRDTPKRAKE